MKNRGILHFRGYDVTKHNHKRVGECIKLIGKVENMSENDTIAVLVRLGAQKYCDFFSSMFDDDEDTRDMPMKYDRKEDKFYYENRVEVDEE